MQLVNQLWAMELNAHSGPGRQMGLFKAVAKQASQAVKAGLELLGAKKFLEASSAASEAKQYKKAISLSVQAERVLLQVEATNRNASTNPEDVIPVPVELRCRIFLVAGTHRAFYSDFLKANAAKKIPVDKAVRKELLRAKELLFKAIEPECVRAGAANGAAGNGQLHIALNYLAGIVNGEVDQSRVESVEEYAGLLSTSYLMLHLQEQLTSAESASASSVVSSKEDESALVVTASTPPPAATTPFGDLDTIRDNAARMWNTVGNWHQKARQADEAAESFEQALRLFTVLPAAEGGLMERHAVTVAAMRRHLFSMELSNVSCNSLYWWGFILLRV
jgi:tetratricopeptide (TPR) repeat protein